MTDSGIDRYGQFYWCIRTALSRSGKIYVMADDAQILADGTLAMIRRRKEEGHTPSINLALAAGQWSACYAASMVDGGAVAVEHWEEVAPH